MLGTFLMLLRHIWDIFWITLGSCWDVLCTFFGHARDIFRTGPSHLRDMFETFLGQFWDVLGEMFWNMFNPLRDLWISALKINNRTHEQTSCFLYFLTISYDPHYRSWIFDSKCLETTLGRKICMIRISYHKSQMLQPEAKALLIPLKGWMGAPECSFMLGILFGTWKTLLLIYENLFMNQSKM